MRHTLITFALSLLSIVSYSQRGFNGWFHFGLKGGLGTTYMFHKNMITDENVQMKGFNLAYTGGYQLGVTFASVVEVTFEASQNNLSQGYNFMTNNFDYDQTFNVSYRDNSGFARLLTENGYVELGYGQ